MLAKNATYDKFFSDDFIKLLMSPTKETKPRSQKTDFFCKIFFITTSRALQVLLSTFSMKPIGLKPRLLEIQRIIFISIYVDLSSSLGMWDADAVCVFYESLFQYEFLSKLVVKLH